MWRGTFSEHGCSETAGELPQGSKGGGGAGGQDTKLGDRILNAQQRENMQDRIWDPRDAREGESAHLLQVDIFVPVAHPHSRAVHILRHRPLLS